MRQKTNDRSCRYDAARKSPIFDWALQWYIVVPNANRAFATHPNALFRINKGEIIPGYVMDIGS
jgi:hypothetical protein